MRKDGNHAFRSVRDPMLFAVQEFMRACFQAHLPEAMTVLQEMDGEGVKTQ